MANKSIASVVIELDAAQTGKSFNKLYSIVYDRIKKLPDVYVLLDEKKTRQSFSKLKSIVESEIKKVQNSISAVGNITINGLDINKTLIDISTNIDSIKNKLDQLANSASNAGRAGSRSSKLLVAGQKEYETRLTRLVKLQNSVNNVLDGDKYDLTKHTTEVGKLNQLDSDINQLMIDMAKGTVTARKFDTQYAQLDRTLAENAKTVKSSAAPIKYLSKEYESASASIASKQSEINKLIADYSAAANNKNTSGAYSNIQKLKGDFESLRYELGSGKLTVDEFKTKYDKLSASLSKSKGEIEVAGLAHKSLRDVIKGMPAAFGAYFTSAKLVADSVRFFKQAVNAAIELQDALVDLQIVTGSTGSDFINYARGVSRTAQEIGVETNSLVTATTTYARLGYSLPDSNELAKYTAMLEKVGGIDPQAAQDSLTAMLSAFPDDVNIKNIEQAMDKLVVVGKYIAQQCSNALKEIGYIGQNRFGTIVYKTEERLNVCIK